MNVVARAPDAAVDGNWPGFLGFNSGFTFEQSHNLTVNPVSGTGPQEVEVEGVGSTSSKWGGVRSSPLATFFRKGQ